MSHSIGRRVQIFNCFHFEFATLHDRCTYIFWGKMVHLFIEELFRYFVILNTSFKMENLRQVNWSKKNLSNLAKEEKIKCQNSFKPNLTPVLPISLVFNPLALKVPQVLVSHMAQFSSGLKFDLKSYFSINFVGQFCDFKCKWEKN